MKSHKCSCGKMACTIREKKVDELCTDYFCFFSLSLSSCEAQHGAAKSTSKSEIKFVVVTGKTVLQGKKNEAIK